MKILVIEDNPDITEVLDYILKDDGHEVISCPDGTSLNSLDIKKPDVILMDDILSTTTTRGSEFCRLLKSDGDTKNIPVILISARPNLQDTARKCGADTYIEKPFNIDHLVNVVKLFAKT
ncbi:MAG: response regulator [Mucilaginibacter sp.]|nr:response regulator [Mucilaginibacter sp.]